MNKGFLYSSLLREELKQTQLFQTLHLFHLLVQRFLSIIINLPIYKVKNKTDLLKNSV